MDSGKLIEDLFIVVKRAEKEATRATTEVTGKVDVPTSSTPDCESQHHKSERHH